MIKPLVHYNMTQDGNLIISYTAAGKSVLMDYKGLGIAQNPQLKSGGLALIDRDGVIVQKAPYHQYHVSPNTMTLIPEAAHGIKLLNEKNIPAVVITNQPGIFKGLFTREDLYAMNMILQENLEKEAGAHLDSVIFCGHPAITEGDNVLEEDLCGCRKPKPGMLELALDLYNGDARRSFFFEDFSSGIRAARNAGVNPIYVATQHDEYESMQKVIKTEHPEVFRDFQFPNLLDAIQFLFGA
jgi:D-glycero-D-manno-heptose 1,7-bisphosphate phosphatase